MLKELIDNKLNLNKKTNYIVFFLILFLAKLLILGCFTSDYVTTYFIPFLKIFISGDLNPWQTAYKTSTTIEFPYHPLMLYLLSPFYFLAQFFDGNQFLFNILLKFPLMVFDYLLFYILIKFDKGKLKQISIFYLLNPIIIYAIYIHSQLDVIPMSLLCLCLYFTYIKKLTLSSLFLGFALATKAHVFLAALLIFIYIQKVFGLKSVIRFIAIALVTLLFFDFPYLGSSEFINMVWLNSKQNLLLDSHYLLNNNRYFFAIGGLFVVILHFINQRKVNFDLLTNYIGMLFTIILIFVKQYPAWYVWILPFLCLFIIKSKEIGLKYSFMAFFCCLYLIFFLFCITDSLSHVVYLGKPLNLYFDLPLFSNIIFTLLTTSLVGILYIFYKFGIKSNNVYKKISNIAIGVCGDSGSGKSLFLDNIKDIFTDRLLLIEGDGDHKWERNDKNWNEFTHLNPKANYLHKQANSIIKLKHNQYIKRVDYNHDTGKFSKEFNIEPRDFVAIAGLHTFYLPKLRQALDLKIFMAPQEELRQHWKISRDTKKRGYSKEKVLKQLNFRKKDSMEYIHPQKKYADLIIEYIPLATEEQADFKNLGLRLTFDANIDIEPFIDQISQNYTWNYSNDLKKQTVLFIEEPMIDFAELSIRNIPNCFEILGYNYTFKNGFVGTIQFFTLKMTSDRMISDN